MTSAEIDLDALFATMAAAHGARAPLIVWMVDHHDAFAAQITRHRINWTQTAAWFADQGFRNARGGPLTAETVRSYWKRARRIVAEQRRPGRRRHAPANPPDQP